MPFDFCTLHAEFNQTTVLESIPLPVLSPPGPVHCESLIFLSCEYKGARFIGNSC